jgi:hypothetical protein
VKQKKQNHRDIPRRGKDPDRSNLEIGLATRPASSDESAFAEEPARVGGIGPPRFPVRPKATDSHHHIYDARYPVDPSAQLQPPDATVADYRALQQRSASSDMSSFNRLRMEPTTVACSMPRRSSERPRAASRPCPHRDGW